MCLVNSFYFTVCATWVWILHTYRTDIHCTHFTICSATVMLVYRYIHCTHYTLQTLITGNYLQCNCLAGACRGISWHSITTSPSIQGVKSHSSVAFTNHARLSHLHAKVSTTYYLYQPPLICFRVCGRKAITKILHVVSSSLLIAKVLRTNPSNQNQKSNDNFYISHISIPRMLTALVCIVVSTVTKYQQ
jgi:hypothetical protein